MFLQIISYLVIIIIIILPLLLDVNLNTD